MALARSYLARVLLLAALAPALALSFTSAAHATYDPLASGQTRIVLDQGLLSYLRSHGVSLEAKAPARLKGAVLTLPVSGGKVDPESAKGRIEHEGELVLRSKRRRVPLREIALEAKRTPLLAKVGGSQLKLASAEGISSRREGFGLGFSAKGLSLSAKAATRLDKKLGLGRTLEAGQPFGQSTSKTQPASVALLPKGTATLTPDPAFMAKLASLFVSLNPIFPAEAVGGVFSFPIALKSAIAPNAALGTLRAAGELEFLQLGGGQLFWHEPWADLGARGVSFEVDTQPAPPFAGKQGRVGVLGLGAPASVASDPGRRTISLGGAPLALDAAAAANFNAAFAEGRAVFAAGEVVGALGFGAVGR